MIENNTALYTKAFIISAVLVVILSWTNALDYLAVNYVDDALLDAGIAFGVARTINAIGSMLESITLGAGATISLGEMLSPVIDMATDFSTVMKFSIASLVLQKLLINIVDTLFFNVLLTLSAIAAGASLILGYAKIQLFSIKVFITLVVIRFLVVLVALLSGVISQLFLDEHIKENLETLTVAESAVREMQEDESVSPEVTNQLQSSIDTYEKEQFALLENQAKLESLVESYQSEIEELELERSDFSLTERLSLSENSKLDELELRLSEKEASLKKIETELETTLERLSYIEDELFVLNKKIKGEPIGFFDSISNTVADFGRKFDAISNQFEYSKIKNKTNDIINAMLVALASFVLRCLILPLLFLYLVSRLFKAVWGIDLGKKLKDKTDNLNSAKKHKAAEVQS